MHTEKFEKILVNGKTVTTEKGLLQLRDGFKKISFFSNSYKPVHYTVAPQKLATLTLPLKPYAEGTCSEPRLFETSKTSAVFYGLNCIKKNGHILPNKASLDIAHNAIKPIPRRNHFWKRNRTLLWVGASLLGAFATWQASQRPSSHQSTPDVRAQPAAPRIYTLPNSSK